MAVVVGGESISLMGMAIETKCIIETHRIRLRWYCINHSFYSKSHLNSCTVVHKSQDGGIEATKVDVPSTY